MTRRPPRSPLVPYTALFRSGRIPGRGPGVDVEIVDPADSFTRMRPFMTRQRRARPPRGPRGPSLSAAGFGRARRGARRSEEHTFELQSRQYLVCRLLLEKKK